MALTAKAADPIQADICVYGATPSGILAAVTAKQEGKSVVLIEPSRWVGGILGAGIKPLQDWLGQRTLPESHGGDFRKWYKERKKT